MKQRRGYKFILTGFDRTLNKSVREEAWGSLKEAKTEAIKMSKKLNDSVSIAKVIGHVHVENVFYLWH